MRFRRCLGWVLPAALLLGAGLRAAQPENNVWYGMAEKGTHGLVNVVTGWWEFPKQIYIGYDEGVASIKAPACSRSLGATLGVVRGLFHAAGRTCWGAVQLVGFWSSNPTDNKAFLPLLDSEYAWQRGVKRTVVVPDIDPSIEKIGNHIERGLRNIVGGPVELPGQIYKSDYERRIYLGLVKAVWFALSRELYGLADVGLCLLPMPENNLGVPFDEVEGWDAISGRYYNNVK